MTDEQQTAPAEGDTEEKMAIEAMSPEGIYEWVGDDLDRARLAVAAEEARGDDARAVVIEPLRDWIASADAAAAFEDPAAPVEEPDVVNEAAPVADERQPVAAGSDVSSAIAQGIADRRAARG